jgi:hypothetical protein
MKSPDAASASTDTPSLPVLPGLTKRHAVKTMGDILVEIQTKQAADAASAADGGVSAVGAAAAHTELRGAPGSVTSDSVLLTFPGASAASASAIASAGAGAGAGAGASAAGSSGANAGVGPVGGMTGTVVAHAGSGSGPAATSSSAGSGSSSIAPPRRAQPSLPRMLDDDWEVQEQDVQVIAKIGGGNFGDVFRGRLWGSDVAVKLLVAAVVTEEVRLLTRAVCPAR